MAYTNDRSKVLDKYKRETNKKIIKFDKKSRFNGKLFKGTQPSNNFKNVFEVYKDEKVTMQEVKKLFKVGYDHIKPDSIKEYNKIIKDFIDYYNLNVTK